MEIRAGRKLPEHVVGFELWWRGFDVDVDAVRSYLARLLDESTAELLATPDPYDLADNVEKTLEGQRPQGPLPSLLLERLGGDERALVSGIYALALLLRGVEPVLDTTSEIVGAGDETETTPESAVLHLVGFDRAMTDTVPGTKETLLGDNFDLLGFFYNFTLAEMIGSRFSTPVSAATDEQLEKARTDAVTFSQLFRELAETQEHAFGKDFSGFGIFTLRRPEQEERFHRLTIFLALLVLRDQYAEEIDLINQTLQERISEVRTYNAIVERFPEYARYLRYDQAEQLATMTPEDRQKMASDISAFLEERRPPT
jgi:hypothetical protein